jgi:hypothetical protein
LNIFQPVVKKRLDGIGGRYVYKQVNPNASSKSAIPKLPLKVPKALKEVEAEGETKDSNFGPDEATVKDVTTKNKNNKNGKSKKGNEY